MINKSHVSHFEGESREFQLTQPWINPGQNSTWNFGGETVFGHKKPQNTTANPAIHIPFRIIPA